MYFLYFKFVRFTLIVSKIINRIKEKSIFEEDENSTLYFANDDIVDRTYVEVGFRTG